MTDFADLITEDDSSFIVDAQTFTGPFVGQAKAWKVQNGRQGQYIPVTINQNGGQYAEVRMTRDQALAFSLALVKAVNTIEPEGPKG